MPQPALHSLPSASLLRRLAAGMYDSFLLFAVAFLYTLAVALLAEQLGMRESGLQIQSRGDAEVLLAGPHFQPLLQGPLYQLGLYLSLIAFYLWFWRTRGATLGMQTWNLRLIDAHGARPSWRQLAMRALVGTLSLAAGGLGFAYAIIDRQGRTWHDLASATRVVVIPKTRRQNPRQKKPRQET